MSKRTTQLELQSGMQGGGGGGGGEGAVYSVLTLVVAGASAGVDSFLGRPGFLFKAALAPGFALFAADSSSESLLFLFLLLC